MKIISQREARPRSVVSSPGNTEISRGACQGRGGKEGSKRKREIKRAEESEARERWSQPCVAASSGSSSRGVRIEC